MSFLRAKCFLLFVVHGAYVLYI